MILKICTALVFFSSFSIISSVSVLGQQRREIKVYLVAVGDNGQAGKKIGCDDSLVAVTRKIKTTPAPLKAAIQELLSAPPETGDNPKLQNFWKGRNLKVRSASIQNHTATIRILGEVFVAGVCDEPRIKSPSSSASRAHGGGRCR